MVRMGHVATDVALLAVYGLRTNLEHIEIRTRGWFRHAEGAVPHLRVQNHDSVLGSESHQVEASCCTPGYCSSSCVAAYSDMLYVSSHAA